MSIHKQLLWTLQVFVEDHDIEGSDVEYGVRLRTWN